MTKKNLVLKNYNKNLTPLEISLLSGVSVPYVREVLRNNNLKTKRKIPEQTIEVKEKHRRIKNLCDGFLTSKEIAEKLGYNHKYIQKIMLKLNLPRRKKGSATGALNGKYKNGRIVDLDGYSLVPYPKAINDYKFLGERKNGRILEHRLIYSKILKRPLKRGEIVDHIDGLRLHNCPSNLRLFSSNAEHLKKTLKGKKPCLSSLGKVKACSVLAEKKSLPLVNRYHQMKVSGDARLIQILLLSLKLGIDSPYLLGTTHHLENIGISDFSRSNLKHKLDFLYQKWELNH